MCLSDLLNYGILASSGVVLCKDGSLLAGFVLKGQDSTAMTNESRNELAATMNSKLKGLGSGWTLHVDAIRRQAAKYPERESQYFPDPISLLIDNERRALFESAGVHYETICVVTLNYLPPLVARSKLDKLAYAQNDDVGATVADKLLLDFVEKFVAFVNDLSQVCRVVKLASFEVTGVDGKKKLRDGLVNYLNFCVSGLWHDVNLSESVIFLDSFLGRYDMVGGMEPAMDNQFIRVITIDSYPGETFPGMLDALTFLPLEYRWSTRFIYMDGEEAKKELTKYRKKWKQKERGFMDQIFNIGSGTVDQDAVNMVAQADAAMAGAASEAVSFGFFTSVVVVRGTDKDLVMAQCAEILNMVRRHGCGGRMETLNAMDAWLGSLPSHVYSNVRRPLIHSLNLVDLLPLSSLWEGSEFNPCGLYAKRSPPLFFADSQGGSIFRFNLHVADVGHTLVIGPTGSGKSTLLALMAAQFRKYHNANVFCFDKGASLFCLTHALGGDFFDIAAEDSELTFSPMSEMDTQEDVVWVEEWVASLCVMQMGRELKPDERAMLHDAVLSLSHVDKESRSLTALSAQLQDVDMREALGVYTVGGSMGKLIDGEMDGLSLSKFACFELEQLMNYDDKSKMPVLMYLFRRVEKALTGDPALILIDEAWLMLSHPAFRGKIMEWLKVMRKNNAAVVMATQSLSDATRSGILDIILESTATKVFLPNPSATSATSRPAYEQIGLNHAQIELIAAAKPKRHYYMSSSLGDRLVDLALGEVGLAFMGQSGNAVREAVKLSMDMHGRAWPREWLKVRGVFERATQLGFVLSVEDNVEPSDVASDMASDEASDEGGDAVSDVASDEVNVVSNDEAGEVNEVDEVRSAA